jgi:hypothetical protein
MKCLTSFLMAAGCLLAMNSCETQKSLGANATAANDWLKLQQGASRINVTGTWFSEDWGRADLKQSGRDITGRIDTYEVKGVVSGSKAYLTTWDSGKCYYAVVLSQTSRNTLSGTYTDGPIFLDDAKEQRPVEFRRSY